MGIRTKFNPMGGLTGGKKYKAYVKNIGTGDAIYDNGIDGSFIDINAKFNINDIDPDKTFGAVDQTVNSNLFVINGQLYWGLASYGDAFYIGDSSDKWTSVSGIVYESYCSGLGICDGKLYQLYTSNNTLYKTQMGNDTGWTQVSGLFYNSSYGDSYPLAIRNGQIYVIKNSSNITQITANGTSANFKLVKGFLNSGYASRYQTRCFGLAITTSNQLAWINPINNKYILINTSNIPATVSKISSGFFDFYGSTSSYPNQEAIAYFTYDSDGKIGAILNYPNASTPNVVTFANLSINNTSTGYTEVCGYNYVNDSLAELSSNCYAGFLTGNTLYPKVTFSGAGLGTAEYNSVTKTGTIFDIESSMKQERYNNSGFDNGGTNESRVAYIKNDKYCEYTKSYGSIEYQALSNCIKLYGAPSSCAHSLIICEE